MFRRCRSAVTAAGGRRRRLRVKGPIAEHGNAETHRKGNTHNQLTHE